MIVLHLRARDVDALISQGYDTIKVYRDVSAIGPFSTLIGTVTPLVSGQEFYDFVDNSGTSSNFYEFSYYRSVDAVESAKSIAFNPGPVVGPLGVLTVDFVRNTTDIPAIANLDASKVGEFILRAETEIINYTNRFGGLNVGAVGYSTTMPIIARLVLEEIYLRSGAKARARAAYGLASERIGSYSYTTRANDSGDAGYWTAEIISLLTPFLLGTRLQTTITTTRVFKEGRVHEDVPGVKEKHYHNRLDSEFRYSDGVLELLFPMTPNIDDWWDV